MDLNDPHKYIGSSLKGEGNSMLPFLAVMVNCRSGGSVFRSVYRRATWTRQGLAKTLFARARKMCSSKTVKGSSFASQMYSSLRFIVRNIKKYSKPRSDTPGFEGKPVFIQLPLKGDDVERSVFTVEPTMP